MPLIVNNIILHILTQRTPWLFRPLVGFLLGKLREILVEPGLRTHAQMVRTADTSLAYETTDCLDRSRSV